MQNTDYYEWTVVGAGPAGIAALGNLLDKKIDPARVAWIDPDFQVGDFGTKWLEVPGNTKVHLFLKFLSACDSFEYSNCKEKYSLHEFDPQDTCKLLHMAQPLQWVTNKLRKKVKSVQNKVQKFKLENKKWSITLDNGNKIQSKNVVLAIGAEAKNLVHPHLKTIFLETALDKNKLKEFCNGKETVALFGSSHSAILALRHLLESNPYLKVVHFYLKPLRYAVYLDQINPAQPSVVLFDDTGLKGSTAQWARENLHGQKLENYESVYASNENLINYLPSCTHAVYAVGFQKRSVCIEGLPEFEYNDKTGIIAPGIFGAGIAFPEVYTNQFGQTESRVGLWKFMEYLNRIVPVWLKYGV